MTFRELVIGDKFTVFLVFNRRRLQGTKVSDTHALYTNESKPKRIDSSTSVTRIN